MIIKDIDHQVHHEKWFIECKHYKKGVPPEKIQGALAWANSQRPSVLLIVVSNFLSNAAKNYLNDYRINNTPPYRIKIWEVKDLEDLSAEKYTLRRKYGLSTETPFLNILNKYHLIYVIKPQVNTVQYLVELMDQLDEEKRDKAFGMMFFVYVSPRFRDPVTGNEKLADLQLDASDYKSFRSKCLKGAEESPTYVHNFVSSSLAWLFNFADKTALDDMIQKQKWLLEQLLKDAEETDDPAEREKFLKMSELPKKQLTVLPQQVEDYYELYNYVCENLVRKLLTEKPNIGRL